MVVVLGNSHFSAYERVDHDDDENHDDGEDQDGKDQEDDDEGLVLVVVDKNLEDTYGGQYLEDDDDVILEEKLMEAVDKVRLVLDIPAVGHIDCVQVEEVVGKYQVAHFDDDVD